MSLDDYVDYLERHAHGWFDWTEAEVQHADVNAIEVGIAGKLEMFELLGLVKRAGKPRAPSGPPLDARGRPITMTPSRFDEMFDREPGTWQVRVKGVR